MAAPAESCFSCSLFGCRVVCLTPSQPNPDFLNSPGHTDQTDQRIRYPQKQAFLTKKRREIWMRNILIVLYCLAGVGGLAMLTTELIGHNLRSPTQSCQRGYIGTGDSFCNTDLIPDNDPLEISDIILLAASCGTVCLASIGIIAAIKQKSCCLSILSAGFVVAIGFQVAAAGTILSREVDRDYSYPYVSDQVQHTVKNNMENSMPNYQSNPSDRELWDSLQHQECCCGINGPTEWEVHTTIGVPESCHCICEKSYEAQCYWKCPVGDNWGYSGGSCAGDSGEHLTGNITVPKRGCFEAVLYRIGDHRRAVVTVVSIIAFSLTSLQLLAALGPLLACCCRCCCESPITHVGMHDLYEPLTSQPGIDAEEEQHQSRGIPHNAETID